MARLTKEHVLSIRNRAANGEKGRTLATAFGVSVATISMVIRGLIWTEVGGPIKKRSRRASPPPPTQGKWQPIPDYEGVYSVSNRGSVRIEVKRRNISPGQHLIPSTDRDGYLYVVLANQGRSRSRRVSLLVLAAFVGPRPPGQETNHKDGNRQNNHVSNLEYVTPGENTRHSIEVLGSTRRGAKNPAAKLTKKQVVELRERAAVGENYQQLSNAFGVSSSMCGLIARGQAWKDTGGPRISGRPVGRPPQTEEIQTHGNLKV